MTRPVASVLALVCNVLTLQELQFNAITVDSLSYEPVARISAVLVAFEGVFVSKIDVKNSLDSYLSYYRAQPLEDDATEGDKTKEGGVSKEEEKGPGGAAGKKVLTEEEHMGEKALTEKEEASGAAGTKVPANEEQKGAPGGAANGKVIIEEEGEDAGEKALESRESHFSLFDQFKVTDQSPAFVCEPGIFKFHPAVAAALAACKVRHDHPEDIPMVVEVIDRFIEDYVIAFDT